MRVLIIKTSSMGDILHTLPALTDAKKHIPEITFDWVVEEGFAEIPTWHYAVDRIIPVAIRRWRKNWFSSSIRQERKQFLESLKSREYDCVIDGQGLIKSAFLVTRKARGIKHGFDKQSARESIASYFYDIKHNISKELHAVERLRILFAESLNYDVPSQTGEYSIAQYFLTQPTVDKQRYIVFLHSTTRYDKHWLEPEWRQLIVLLETSGYKIKLPWGNEAEYERSLRLAKGFSHVEVLPKLLLSQIALVLAGADIVVSVDTGLSHLTAALDRPNITLYGPTDPNLIGGYGQNQHSLISYQKNMQTIAAQAVYEKIKYLIKLNA